MDDFLDREGEKERSKEIERERKRKSERERERERKTRRARKEKGGDQRDERVESIWVLYSLLWFIPFKLGYYLFFVGNLSLSLN